MIRALKWIFMQCGAIKTSFFHPVGKLPLRVPSRSIQRCVLDVKNKECLWGLLAGSTFLLEICANGPTQWFCHKCPQLGKQCLRIETAAHGHCLPGAKG